METTALGAAYAAGIAVGVWEAGRPLGFEGNTTYASTITVEEREKRMQGWRKAVQRTLEWES